MGFSGMSIGSLVLIALIVLLLFGSKKLRGLGADVGSAVKGFRGAMTEGEAAKDKETKDKEASQATTQLNQDESGRVIDSETTSKDETKV